MPQASPIGLPEARLLVSSHVRPLDFESAELTEAVDRTAARDLYARVDSPSVDASLKDGYAVCAAAVAGASSASPVRLRLAGQSAAGACPGARVTPQTTVRVLTGAGIPPGADAVVSEEFTFPEKEVIVFNRCAEAGRNVMGRGSDVAAGEPIVAAGQLLTPTRVGLLAAAGHSRVPVFARPRVAIVATGDEVVAPGSPLVDGKLYASNMVTLAAWCRRFGMLTRTAIVRDDAAALAQVLHSLRDQADALITSGGAWTGERDLTAGVLRQMQWRPLFHRVRMGPGKAVGFGLLGQTPVFILPGGPPSNVIGFLQIALPGLLQQSGRTDMGLPELAVRAAQALNGYDDGWTHFVFGRLEASADLPLFIPLRQRSRLQSMAQAQALVALPEGFSVSAGSVLRAQLLEGWTSAASAIAK